MSRQLAGRQRDPSRRTGGRRPAFTLVELLVVITVIAILAGMTLFALYGTIEDARESRTRSIVIKIDGLLKEKWEAYQFRPIRVDRTFDPSPLPNLQPLLRLVAVRTLLRMEFPERKTDLVGPAPVDSSGKTLLLPPLAVNQQIYIQLVQNAQAVKGVAPADAFLDANWTPQYENAECLYLILSALRTDRGPALKDFSTAEIGDVDGDGMNEILDGWGRPIRFLRWAPALVENPGDDGEWGVAGIDDDGNGTIDDLGEAAWPGSDDIPSPSAIQSVKNPDAFDPLKVDPRWNPGTTFPGWTSQPLRPFDLQPLVYSAGRDGVYGIRYVPAGVLNLADPEGGGDRTTGSTDYTYGTLAFPNDPYSFVLSGDMPNSPLPFDVGYPLDLNWRSYGDNVTNHLLDTE